MARHTTHVPTPSQMDSQNAVGTHVAQRLGRNRMRQHTVDQDLLCNANRFKHPGIGAARPDWLYERTTLKNNSRSTGEIGRGHRQRNSQLLKALYLENVVEEARHASVGGETVTGDRPAGKVAKAHPAGDFFHLGGRGAGAVNRPDQGTNAGPGYEVNGDVFLFEDFQDTDVGNTAGESTPQSNSYPGTGARGGMLALAATDLAAQTPYRLNDSTYYS